MDNIKEFLLDTGYFIDNDYLNKYIDIVSQTNNKDSKLVCHHILPRSYFKWIMKDEVVYDHNTVMLTYHDHLLCHIYLVNCTSGKLYHLMVSALSYMLKVQDVREEFDLTNCEKIIEWSKNLINEYNLQKGSITWNLKTDEEKEEWVDLIMSSVRGVHKSDNHRKKISKSNEGKHSGKRGQMSDDHKKKLCKPKSTTENMHGNKSELHCKHISESLMNYSVGESTRVKLSEYKKSHPSSRETLDKIAKANSICVTVNNVSYCSIKDACKKLHVGYYTLKKMIGGDASGQC